MKTLKSVQNVLNSICDINYGGCGISALAMYRWLKNNNKLKGNESFTYLYISFDNCFYENDPILKKEVDRRLSSCSHIMLNRGGKHYDSEGSNVKSRFTRKHKKITEEQLIESLNFGEWNDTFDRETYIPFIEKKLNVDLSDIVVDHY